jgi:nicotinic acid mononucleotide adenylyltransferase
MPQRSANQPQEAPITPLKVQRSVKTLVVYGGSFDPPHEYHRWAWCAVRMTLGDAARTLYVPAAANPLKARGPIASDEDRVAMLLADEPPMGFNRVGAGAGLWTDEIDRARWHRAQGDAGPPSYTIDTIRRLRTIIPPRVTLRLLIGSDQALAFHRWKEWKVLLREAEPIVLLREPAPTAKELFDQLDKRVWSMRERLAWVWRVAPYAARRSSSTRARRVLARQPLDYAKWSEDAQTISEAVGKYIIEHRLYGVGTKCKPSKRRKA